MLMNDQSEYDVLIVGAGFAGLYMLHRARGLGLSARVVEAGGGIGGTWYWNRYPGARCDVESMHYSYQFSGDSSRSGSGASVTRPSPRSSPTSTTWPTGSTCARHPAWHAGRAASFDEAASRWVITTDGGEQMAARFLVMATGCLSAAKIPDIPGRDSLRADVPHRPLAARPRRLHRAAGRGHRHRILGHPVHPVIARQAASLVVFQRTATYSIPAHNHPLAAAEQREVKADYAAFRRRNSQTMGAIGSSVPLNDVSALAVGPGERAQAYQGRWEQGGLAFLWAFNDLMLDRRANEPPRTSSGTRSTRSSATRPLPTCCRPDGRRLQAAVRRHRLLRDLQPRQRRLGRPARVSDRDHAAGAADRRPDCELDCLVYATGFDAMTGALLRIDIRGRGGLSLGEAWAQGPRTFLGLGVAGFPNLFLVSGPGSPSVLTNMVVSIEQHVNWITDCLAYLSRGGYQRIEAQAGAQDEWVAHVNGVADLTLYPSCNSWYLGANVPGKPRVFMPLASFPPYVEKCDKVAARDYQGFTTARS